MRGSGGMDGDGETGGPPGEPTTFIPKGRPKAAAAMMPITNIPCYTPVQRN